MINLIIIVLILSSIACLYRVLLGPTPPDRVVGLSVMTSNVTALLVVLGLSFERHIYLDVALVYAMLSFISVIAISKYLERREFHE